MNLTTKRLADQLQKMVGNSYRYNGKDLKVIALVKNGVHFELDTDSGRIKIPLTSTADDFRKFVPMESASSPEKEKPSMALIVTSPGSGGGIEKIKQTVFETIEKIKAEPSYLPQANAINANINTLINLGKLELEAIRLAKKLE